MHLVQAGIWQGSPVFPILFANCISWPIICVEKRVSGVEDLSFMDNIWWVAIGSEVKQIVWELTTCIGVKIHLVEQREVGFVMTKTDVVLFTCQRGHKIHLGLQQSAKIRVGNGFVRFNMKGTRWYVVWLDAHLMFQEHHNQCMKSRRAAEAWR